MTGEANDDVTAEAIEEAGITIPEYLSTLSFAVPRQAWEESQAEVERLTKKIADYEADWVPMIGDREGLRIDSRGVMVSMRGARRVVKTVAAAMARMLGDATNYVECEMKPAGEPGYTVTIRRSEKPTPHELRQRAEAEVERLRGIVEAVEKLVDPDTAMAMDRIGQDRLFAESDIRAALSSAPSLSAGSGEQG